MNNKSAQHLFNELRSKNKEESEKLQKSILPNWMEFRESMKMVNLCQQMKHAILNDWLKNSEKRNDFISSFAIDLISRSVNKINSIKKNMSTIFKNAFSAKS